MPAPFIWPTGRRWQQGCRRLAETFCLPIRIVKRNMEMNVDRIFCIYLCI